jgi:putative mRNA 3-end processing factor
MGPGDEQPGPIWVHPAVDAMCQAYRAAGVHLPDYRVLPKTAQQLAGTDRQQPLLQESRVDFSKAIIVAPPALLGGAWAQSLPRSQAAFASGWMRLRSGYRRQRMDRGFVLSDHADWPGLTGAIAATGAERVIVMHGYEDSLCGWLREQGLRAERFGRASGWAEHANAQHPEASTGTVCEPDT